MARTSRAQVGAVVELDTTIVPDDAAMEAYILPASELVTEYCTGTTHGPAVPYTDQRLELIERWLAAHFYTTRDPRLSSEGAGGVSASYQSRVDLGFDASHFGQMALRLDTNGGLARLNTMAKEGRGRVGGMWLGTTPERQPTPRYPYP